MSLVGRTLKGRTLKDNLVGDIICESTGETLPECTIFL